MKKSNIVCEKFESNSGIYIIFNTKAKKKTSIYIGKASNLKDRAITHIRNLFEGNDNNPKLTAEFTRGGQCYRYGLLQTVAQEELDKFERIYYHAAKQLSESIELYNSQPLPFEPNSSSETEAAQKRIIEAIDRKAQMKGVNIYTNLHNINQDWIDLEGSNIESKAKQLAEEIRLADETVTLDKLPKLDAIKVKTLYDRGDLEYMLIGTMGDYVGNNLHSQTFTDILTEKMADLASYGKCLWATSGPNIPLFNYYRNKHENGQKKKLYALFSLTVNKYTNKSIQTNFGTQSESVYYSWKDSDTDQVLFDTAPYRKSGKFKALVINKLWYVEEDFLRDRFTDLFYHASICEDKKSGVARYILSTDLCAITRSSLINVFSKKAILNRKDLQETLNLKGELLEDFITKRPCPDFPSCSDREQHPVYYFLAEISDYVEIQNCSNNMDKRFNAYKKTHPYFSSQTTSNNE